MDNLIGVVVGMLVVGAGIGLVMLVGWLIFVLPASGDLTQEIVDACQGLARPSPDVQRIIDDIGCP